MKRREFFGGLVGAAAVPFAAHAQQKLPTIGYLGSATATSQRTWVDAMMARLRELGWVEGRTVIVEYRWAEGLPDRFVQYANEFAQRKVDLIFASGTEAAIAAKQATSTIPIVFPVAGEPVGTGLVASLVRPGGNVTGLSNQAADLAAKRLEIMRECFPGLRQIAIMVNADSVASIVEMDEFEGAARTLGIEVVPQKITRTEDIAAVFDRIKGRAQALYVVGDPLMNFNRLRINTFALVAHLPTVHVQRQYVEAAGLLSYGPDYLDLNRRAADYVDKILRGTKPSELPVEQPTKFELVVNLITAKALGIVVPPSLLARANDVIE